MPKMIFYCQSPTWRSPSRSHRLHEGCVSGRLVLSRSDGVVRVSRVTSPTLPKCIVDAKNEVEALLCLSLAAAAPCRWDSRLPRGLVSHVGN